MKFYHEITFVKKSNQNKHRDLNCVNKMCMFTGVSCDMGDFSSYVEGQW